MLPRRHVLALDELSHSEAAALGPLLRAVTAALRAQAVTSPFLAAIDLAARVRLLPAGAPAAVIGAAMIWDAR